MTRAEVYARITEVEERRGLLDHSVDGWCVWPILRKAVADRLTGDTAEAGRKTRRPGPLWKLALNDLGKVSSLGPTRLLVKTYVSGLLDETGDKRFRDIWFDDVIESHGDVVKIEGINNRELIPRRQKAMIPSAATTTLLELMSRALNRALTVSPEVAKTGRELAGMIGAEFGGALSTAAIIHALNNFHWERIFYSWILSRVTPEAVLTADFGEYGLVAAAKERSVPVLELQHGIADRNHPAYAWADYALVHRAALPIADRFLVHGRYWLDELSGSHFWRGAIDIVGSPRIDRFRAIPRTSGRGPYRVLFTADGFECTQTIRVIRELLADPIGGDIDVIVKLHPVYTALDDEIRAAFRDESRVSVLSAVDGGSTFRLLREVDLHVSIRSASHYDAIGLGTPTAILGVGNYDAVEHLYRRGHASLIRNGSDLSVVLERARNNGLPEAVSKFYFEGGAVQNILAVIKKTSRRPIAHNSGSADAVTKYQGISNGPEI